jgi:hypothetical protein
MRRYTRRRRGGNVGIRRFCFWPDFQARWKEWETRWGSFPRFPRGVISTAIFSSFPPDRGGGREHRPRLGRFLLRVQRRAENLFSQEVKP